MMIVAPVIHRGRVIDMGSHTHTYRQKYQMDVRSVLFAGPAKSNSWRWDELGVRREGGFPGAAWL